MASATIFQASPSLKKAAGLINGLVSEHFAKVLSRILQRLHYKDEVPFSEEEREKLQAAFQLDSTDVRLVLDTTTFILQQAAYHLAKPGLLKRHLQEIELNEEKVGLFLQAWSSQGKSVIDRLRSRQFYPRQLEDVDWWLNLQVSQASRSKLKQPNSMFQFTIKEGEDSEKIRVGFTHSELFSFYEKLEAIQEQVDALT